MKLIFRYGKLGRLRFVSHLDLQRFFQRTLSRTDIPVAFTQGFNPHPIMSIASALAMGYESEYEAFEVRIDGNISKQKALESMRSALPDELPVYEVRFVEDNHPSMMSLVKSALYRITPEADFMALCSAADAFLAKEHFAGTRKTKSGEREIDLRPLCIKLDKEENSFFAQLMLTEQDTLKPDMLMNALASVAGIDVPEYKVMRLKLLGENDTPILEL